MHVQLFVAYLALFEILKKNGVSNTTLVRVVSYTRLILCSPFDTITYENKQIQLCIYCSNNFGSFVSLHVLNNFQYIPQIALIGPNIL